MSLANNLVALTEQQADFLDLFLEDIADRQLSLEPKVTVIRKGDSPLIAVHGSGGRCLFLHALAQHLPAGSGVRGVEAAPRETHGEPSIPRDAYLAAVRASQASGPYRLAGYSSGCIIAFELAACLEEAGESIESLILIDPVPPPDGGSRPNDVMSPSARLARRFEIAMLAGITPLSPEYAFVAEVNRDFAAFVAGFKMRRLNAAIRIVHGTRGAYVSSPETLNAWAKFSVRGGESVAIDCDHFEIVREPHVADTGRIMSRWLDASLQGCA